MIYERPSLEEIFLAYYSGDEDGRNDNAGNGDGKPTGAKSTSKSASDSNGSNASKSRSESSAPRVENASYRNNASVSQNE